jgi:hypothetical protein
MGDIIMIDWKIDGKAGKENAKNVMIYNFSIQ